MPTGEEEGGERSGGVRRGGRKGLQYICLLNSIKTHNNKNNNIRNVIKTHIK
jgi:hypothetical protein